MSFYDVMTEKLTDVFKKTRDSNIGKLFVIVSKQLDDLGFTFKRMDDWRDIDNAKGVQLDRLGSNIVQEFRNGQTDEEYRLRIKTKIIANLSKGDIETINNVLTTFLGDKFVGVREMWSLEDPIIPKEPAGILITTRVHTPFPAGVIGRVTAGGITIYWHIVMEPKDVILERQITTGKSVNYVYSGELYSGPVYDSNTEGFAVASSVDIVEQHVKGEFQYPYPPDHSGTITSSTSGTSKHRVFELLQEDVEGLPEIMYAGEYWSKGSLKEKEANINKKKQSGDSQYRYSGDFFSGKE